MKQFIALRAGLLQVTTPRAMRVVDPENDLAELYEQVIGEPVRTAPDSKWGELQLIIVGEFRGKDD